MKREPAVAGYFYEESPLRLRAQLSELISPAAKKIYAKGIIVPHAGYMYSGWVAGKVYGKIVPPDIAIIIGPNHTGMGDYASVFLGEAFIMPMGEVKIAQKLGKELVGLVPFLSTNPLAHAHEHSIEVQIPFLQFINPKIEILPICLLYLSRKEIKELGEAIGEVISRYPDKKILIVGSTDFSHYVPQEVAKEKDFLAIEKITNLDEEGLLDVVSEYKISMCGTIPVAVTIVACKKLGATKGELIDYMTSGDIIKDYASVVGYGGIVIY